MAYDPTQPASYPRRVLLAVTGLSPQVVTETLYALTQRQHPPFVPTEVRLVTTAQGAEHARLNLLSHDPGWFHRLHHDYALPDIAFGPERIEMLTGLDGQPLPDIRTPEENNRAADYITKVVRGLTADDSCALHVSIAGGRKTMGYYLGYALSLFGRPQDRLSHVLVSAPFESHPQFYYPTPQERIIHTLDKEQRPLNCREAGVTLAEIPFVRLRDELPARFLSGESSLTEIVAAANRAQTEPHLALDVRQRTAIADDQIVELDPTDFAVLLWFAQRASRDDAQVDWTTREAAEEFKETAKQVINPHSGDFERIEEALARCREGIDFAEYFRPHKSRIQSALRKPLGKPAAARYEIQRTGAGGASRYFLPLQPGQIEIRC
jgi:CRISPR-associated protein (TIGR02584 family)